jgi:hypothetical protein
LAEAKHEQMVTSFEIYDRVIEIFQVGYDVITRILAHVNKSHMCGAISPKTIVLPKRSHCVGAAAGSY